MSPPFLTTFIQDGRFSIRRVKENNGLRQKYQMSTTKTVFNFSVLKKKPYVSYKADVRIFFEGKCRQEKYSRLFEYNIAPAR